MAIGAAGGFMAGSIVAKLLLDKTGWSKSVEEISKDQKKLEDQCSKLSAKFNEVGESLQKIGRAAAIAGAAIVGGLGVGVKAFADFDAAMTQSTAIMGNLSEDVLKRMEQAAKDVARTTTFSATEAARAYFYLASAGLDAEQSIRAMPAVAKFAQAGMFDLALATDLLTDAQSALGMTIRDDAVANMKNMAHISDVLVKANVLANASVAQFSESLTTRAGAALRLVNKDIEEGAAVLAAFADQGVKGAEAGTRLDIVIRDLQTRAIKNREVFRQLGVEVFDSSGKMKNMADIIGDLERLFTGMTDEQKRSTLMMMEFSDRSVASILNLVGMSDAIRKYETELRKAGGTSEEVASKQLETLNSQWKLVKNQVSLLAMEIGVQLAPTLISVADKIKTVIDRIVAWIEKHPGATKAITMLVAALGVFLTTGGLAVMMLGSLFKNIGAIIKIYPAFRAVLIGMTAKFHAMNLSLKTLAVSLGKLTLAFAAAGAAYLAAEFLRKNVFKDHSREVDELTKKWDILINKIGGGWTNIAQAAVRAQQNILGEVRFSLEDLNAVWDKYGQNSRKAFEAIISGGEGEALRKLFVGLYGEKLKLSGIMETVAQAARREAAGIEHLGDVITETTGAMRPLVEVTQTAIPAAGAMTRVWAELGATLTTTAAPAARDMTLALQTLGETSKEMDQMRGVYDLIFADIINGFGLIIEGAQTMGGFFSDIVTKMIADLGKLVIAEMLMAKKSILADQMKAVASYISSVLKKVPFPLNIALAAGGFALVSKLFSGLTKFAEGGFFDKPTLIPGAVVGEKGPEYILPEKKLIASIREAFSMPKFTTAPALAGVGAGVGGATVTVNMNGPLIHTTGLSRRDMEGAGEEMARIVDFHLRKRVGRG